MATLTQYYKLTMPSYADAADVTVINENSKTIDSTLHDHAAQIQKAEEANNELTAAEVAAALSLIDAN